MAQNPGPSAEVSTERKALSRICVMHSSGGRQLLRLLLKSTLPSLLPKHKVFKGWAPEQLQRLPCIKSVKSVL